MVQGQSHMTYMGIYQFETSTQMHNGRYAFRTTHLFIFYFIWFISGLCRHAKGDVYRYLDMPSTAQHSTCPNLIKFDNILWKWQEVARSVVYLPRNFFLYFFFLFKVGDGTHFAYIFCSQIGQSRPKYKY